MVQLKDDRREHGFLKAIVHQDYYPLQNLLASQLTEYPYDLMQSRNLEHYQL